MVSCLHVLLECVDLVPVWMQTKYYKCHMVSLVHAFLHYAFVTTLMLMKMPESKIAKVIPMRLEMFPSKLKGNQQKIGLKKL